MGRFFNFFFVFMLSLMLIFPILMTHFKPVTAFPLHTSSRWIVDESGQLVKLACVNWVTHLEVVVAEGVSKKLVDAISKKIASMGFNCVRLTLPLFLVTNGSLASLTVRRSFQSLRLYESIAGIQANNPSIINLSLIEAFKAVVASLRANNVMVILDNHISKPGWCCGYSDDNGFFGDRYFDPDQWIQGLTRMATLFKGVANVVGMSLRNKLRGKKENVNVWYRYMQKGAEAVHAANPDVLVILSGLGFATNLSFVRNKSVNLSFDGKLVFEMHWYSFFDGNAWESENLNQVCGRVVHNIMGLSGFLLDQGWPLFVSEFGMDLRGTNVNDNRYMNCFLGVTAELDLDWALWTIGGSYYWKEGVFGSDEVYGILDWNWSETRNSSFLQRISAIQPPFQGPGLSETDLHKVIFHPATGLCVLRRSLLHPLRLGPCTDSDSWIYSSQKTLTLRGTYFCLQAYDLGHPAKLGIICTNCNSKWEPTSDSNMHLSSNIANGSTVCLDVDSDNTLVTNTCKCLRGDNRCNPESQWFKLVDSARCSNSAES